MLVAKHQLRGRLHLSRLITVHPRNSVGPRPRIRVVSVFESADSLRRPSKDRPVDVTGSSLIHAGGRFQLDILRGGLAQGSTT
jgi:hypothetical protein